MKGLHKHELFTVPQERRVNELETTVIAWLNELKANEQLVVGLPEVLGKWDECVPLIMGADHRKEFLDWAEENKDEIRGPIYNLPELNAGFLCMVIDKDFDPRGQQLPEDASQELRGTLASLGNFLTQCDQRAA